MTRILLGAIATFAVAAAFTFPAEAAKKNAATNSGNAPPSSQIAPLTAAECNKAQGAVVTDNSCGTGAACIKEGANGPVKICLNFSQ